MIFVLLFFFSAFHFLYQVIKTIVLSTKVFPPFLPFLSFFFIIIFLELPPSCGDEHDGKSQIFLPIIDG